MSRLGSIDRIAVISGPTPFDGFQCRLGKFALISEEAADAVKLVAETYRDR